MSENEDERDARDVRAARKEVIEAMATSAEQYGAKRSYGRLYGILFFARESLSLDDLADRSGYAKSTVSTAMTTMERYNLVHRRTKQGEGKRAFYEAEDDFGYVIQEFLDNEVRREVRSMSRSLTAAEHVFEEVGTERALQDADRVRDLLELYEGLEALVDELADADVSTLLAAVEHTSTRDRDG